MEIGKALLFRERRRLFSFVLDRSKPALARPQKQTAILYQMNGFNRAQAEHEARMPEDEVTVTGTVQMYLLDGPHAEKPALMEFDGDKLVDAYDTETGEEIEIDEIHETDVNRGIETLREIHAYHGEN